MLPDIYKIKCLQIQYAEKDKTSLNYSQYY